MKVIVVIFLIFTVNLTAQDKVFFKNGTFKEGVVQSIGTDFIFFKNSDSAGTTYKIPKDVVSLIEKYDGKVFVYAAKNNNDTLRNLSKKIKRNSAGIQPFNILTGRFTFVYEYLNKDGKIGFCPVLSISFDPNGIIYNFKTDSTRGTLRHNKGASLVGGADLNFYLGKKEKSRFFIGPRVRYGMNMFIANIEAYTVQTQLGWRLGKPESKFSQHLSFGFGFVRILSLQRQYRINPKESYGWGSINYRIGINW